MTRNINLSPLEETILHLRELADAETSFYGFARQAWNCFEPDPFVSGWHIHAICEHLEAVTRGDIKNLIINIPPRCMKTALASVMWPAWVWLNNPGAQFFYVMSSQDLIDKASDNCKTLVTSHWYKSRWGHRVKLSGSQNTKERWNTTANGFRVGCTILGKIVGKGGHYLVIDDPNNTFESENERKKIIDIYCASLANRVNDPKNAKRILIQQRTAENDLTHYLLNSDAKQDIVALILPMEFDPDRKCKTIALPSTKEVIWEDPRTEKNELLWPERIDRKTLQELYRQIEHPYLIAAQYQQRPSPDEGGIIKKQWFKIWDKDVLPEISFIIQSWDTAFTAEDAKNACNAAYSVCTTWGLFEDRNGIQNILLLNVFRKKVNFHELLTEAARLAEDYRDPSSISTRKSKYEQNYKPDRILIENCATGNPLIHELRRVSVVTIPFNPNKFGDKINRVKFITHLLQDGRVWLLAKETGGLQMFSQNFLDECAVFPNGAFRDQVDTMTQVLFHLRDTGWLKYSLDEKIEEEAVRMKKKITRF